MLKTLLRKELSELKRLYIPAKNKKGEKRSSAGMALLAAIYVLGYISIAFAFVGMGMLLCDAFHAAGLDWLYFTMMALISIFAGVVGSVFSAYSLLFRAKDNELMLSMPIPPSCLLISRMVGIYFMGLVFECMSLLPMLGVYVYQVGLSADKLICWIISIFLLDGIVTCLSCLLGWLVALINSRSSHKSLTTVALSLLFMGVYYFVYFRLNSMLNSLVANAVSVGETLHGKAYPLYAMGEAFNGKWGFEAGFALAVLAALALMLWVLSKSFLHIITRSDKSVKRTYVARSQQVHSQLNAFVKKEFTRFVTCPAYLLNGGLGLLVMPVLAVVAFIKAPMIQELLPQLYLIAPWTQSLISYVPCLIMCIVSAMDVISAPSISLEGNSLWLLKSLPIDVKQLYIAKQLPHLILNGSVTILSVCAASIALKLPAEAILQNAVFSLVFVALTSALGESMGILKPIFDWTNETAPVKSSAATAVTLFGGWAVVVLSGVTLYLTRNLEADVFPIIIVVLAVLAGRIDRWIFTKGIEKFKNL